MTTWTTREDFRADIKKHVDEFDHVWNNEVRINDQPDTETPMQINQVTVSKRFTKNLGDYQSAAAEIGFTATLDEGEDANGAVSTLLAQINGHLANELDLPKPATEAPAPAEKKAAPAKKEAPAPAPAAEEFDPFAEDSTQAEEAPVPAETISEDDFTSAVLAACENGKSAEVMAGLKRHKADRVGAVKPEDRAAFLAGLE